ncbi:hypothetical protein TVAG_153840 [Trichomonas vaginalis G3]|uniref:Uncharacterized protein n=1 Tax=Trichomonas vaginalis (strain ATCC PRA-98 / G3) TaxID=412133 RepID=A2EPT9_TRIV3|nr:hypothetical protein TVAGG3_0352320 [Trichomonas vaginalis G3]EAY05350.1 hypothetical protein TVAG_153840 [Trichomonas vaginalis G3]KAI5531373.1 hypothetical protein TVAGG3_0352320 [Trichomonas vaginalis G3]|eukprot:XP_001317573.1 hypothetical protein [Trichomonas vaginalis G3]
MLSRSLSAKYHNYITLGQSSSEASHQMRDFGKTLSYSSKSTFSDTQIVRDHKHTTLGQSSSEASHQMRDFGKTLSYSINYRILGLLGTRKE